MRTGLLWLRRITIGGLTLFLVAGGSFLPVTASAEVPTLSAQQWCDAVSPEAPQDARKADQVMNGTIDLGKFGTYSLGSKPTWDSQASTDVAGNRSVNSLDWTMPLIRQGLATDSGPMLSRARGLIYSWASAHPVTRPYDATDQPLISGKRAIALNCAATALNDPVIRGLAIAEAGRMVAMQGSWGAPNNTDLVGYTGLLFHACFIGDEVLKMDAQIKLNRVARSLVNKDGSDVEGSPAYANFTLRLLNDAITVMSNCNLNSQTVANVARALETFVSYTIRPNFTWDTIGDSTTERLTTANIAPDRPLYWAASRGTASSPVNLYSPFPDGGYLFARTAWTSQATYYSLRAVPGGRTTPHSHDDSTGFTVYSQGVQWIGDPGPYRYDRSAVRAAITKRPAHSALSVSGIPSRPKGGFTTLRSSADEDFTCIRDDSYKQITMIRCVKYLRTADSFVITDRFIDRRKAKSPTINWFQRWQIPPGITVAPLVTAKGFQLASGSSAFRLTTDSGATLTATPGGVDGSLGLFTGKYGELSPGTTITRKYSSRGKVDVTVVTTLQAGMEILPETKPIQ